MQEIAEVLERMSLEKLRAVAKKLALSPYSNLRKSDLVAHIQASDHARLKKELFPTWWNKHHNHVYGTVSVVGVLLSIVFFAWPTHNASNTGHKLHANQPRRTIEMPIAFADYTAMTPAEKRSFFHRRSGEKFVWEGFLSATIGFELGTLTGVPYDTPVSIEITPTQSLSPQITTECQFGELPPTDSGIELAIQLHLLTIGQRIRLAGELGGVPEQPILKDAWLEAVFPVGE